MIDIYLIAELILVTIIAVKISLIKSPWEGLAQGPGLLW